MSVVVIGIEHQQAPLTLLERVALGDAEVLKVLGTLRAWSNVEEVVVVSTCLRTEVYAVVERFHEAVDEVRDMLSAHAGVPAGALEASMSVRFDDDVAAHLFAVAAGLESAVLGETEVLGQVRRAWERAREEQASGPVLGEMFRRAVQAGKRVRAETGISRGAVSFPHAAVELAEERRPAGLAGSAVAVVGAGEMGGGEERALAALPERRRPASVLVANRHVARARALAEAVGGVAVHEAGTEDLADLAGNADVVFTAIDAGDHVLSAQQLSDARAAARRRGGPLLVVDLGMPRNVEPAAAQVDGVTLLDMGDLRSAVSRALDGRRVETERAAAILAEELARYRRASRERGAGPVIAALRGRLESLRAAEVARLGEELGDHPDALERADAITRAVLAKLLHEPTVALRESSGTPRGERLVEALRSLFDL